LKFGQFSTTSSDKAFFASKAENEKITWLDIDENPVKVTQSFEDVRDLAK